jgi:hypothetical protein
MREGGIGSTASYFDFACWHAEDWRSAGVKNDKKLQKTGQGSTLVAEPAADK